MRLLDARAAAGVSARAVAGTATAVTACRRIYAVSDLHTDYEENSSWIDGLSASAYSEDILIVAGDVADRTDVFRTTMTKLAARFALVFYTPGNHELWLRRDGSEGRTSLHKLLRLDRVCRELGVVTSPQRVQLTTGRGVQICPLVSFHHTSFDTEPDVTALRLPSVQRAMADWRACRFPPELGCGSIALARHVDRYNARLLQQSVAQARRHPALTPWRSWDDATPRSQRTEPLVTFSHFLPSIELCVAPRLEPLRPPAR